MEGAQITILRLIGARLQEKDPATRPTKGTTVWESKIVLHDIMNGIGNASYETQYRESLIDLSGNIAMVFPDGIPQNHTLYAVAERNNADLCITVSIYKD